VTDNAIVPTVNSLPGVPRTSGLIRRSIFTMTQVEVERMKLVANMLTRSQLSSAKMGKTSLSEGDLFIIMLKGIELGFEPLAAIEAIDLIQGKPTLDVAGMLALCNGWGVLENIEFLVETDTTSTIRMKRFGQVPYERTFTIEEAGKYVTTEWVNSVKQSVPITHKDTWKQFPRIMLKCRNLSQMCRYYMGDIVQGLYTPEELGATVQVDDTGRMMILDSGSQPEQEKAETPPQATNPDKLKGSWANPETIQTLLDTLAKSDHGIQGSEAIRLAGIGADKGRDPVEWNKRFETGKVAFNHIKAEFDKAIAKQPPATPKQSSTAPTLTEEMLIDAIRERFPQRLGDFEEVLGAALIDKAFTLQDAINKCNQIVTEQGWAVLTLSAIYDKHISFETAIGQIRFYGRDKLKEMVGEPFFTENGIAEWKKGKHEFNVPLSLTWEQKVGYRLANDVEIFVEDDWSGEETEEQSESSRQFEKIGQP